MVIEMLARFDKVLKKDHQSLQAIFETGLIVAGVLALLPLLPNQIYGDGYDRFQGLSELLEHGKLSNMRYSLVGPLFSSPFWLLGKVYKTSEWCCERYNLFLFAISLLVMYWLLKDRIDRRLIRKFFLILLAASMFAAHLSEYYGEVFTSLCVAIGILAVIIGYALPGWVVIVLGVVNVPASLLALALVVAKRILDKKCWRCVLALVAAGGLIIAESWIRRGGPFVIGYEGVAGYRTVMPYTGLPGFSYPFLFGLLSILFSFGKGLIFFAPGLLLPIRKTLLKIRPYVKVDLFSVYILWLCFLVGLILVYSRWWAWYGGSFWGPRFFLFASIPASFALATRLQYRDTSLLINLFTLLVLLLSFWVGINGAVFGQSNLGICTANHYALEILCLYTPEFSVLWHPFVVTSPLDYHRILYIIYSAIVFIYLLIPLCGTILRQTIEKIGPFSREYLDMQS
ncbi:MAG TPA: hypothetical protein VF043_27950 [Ktedonobacteraceae bacterium]